MKVKIKRFDSSIPLPMHHSAQAAAFDLAAREELSIAPHGIARIPANIAVETPPGHFLLLAARSSLHKKGLMLANGVGIIDPDYAGDGDEIKIAVLNFTDMPVQVEKGERVAQGLFVQTLDYTWEEVEILEGKNRGGFGSTGS